MTTLYAPLFHHKDKNYLISEILGTYTTVPNAIKSSIKYLIDNNYLFSCLIDEDIDEINESIVAYCNYYNISQEDILIDDIELAKSHIVNMMKNINTLDKLHDVCKKFGDSYYGKYGWSIIINESILDN